MIGIVILNYNSANDTIKCIHSIKNNIEVPYKIYLVDGCSIDHSFDYLVSYFKESSDIEILKSDINGGYSYGNNIGAFKAANDGVDAILIVNPDVIQINNAIDLMYFALFEENDLAVVGPRILSGNNNDMQYASKLYSLSGFFSTKKPLAYFNSSIIRNNRYYHFDVNNDYSFQGMVSGCCFMIKTSVFKMMGFFDTNIFLYYEEDALAYKLSEINMFTKIVSNAIVVHNHSTTVKKEGEAFMRFHRFFSAQYVLKRYAKINKFQYFIVFLFHIIPFSLNAIFSVSYMKLYFKFLNKSISLYRE